MRNITRVYLTGSKSDTRPWLTRLQETGFLVTCSNESLEIGPVSCLRGIAGSDVLWALVSNEDSGQQDTELGYAFGLNVPIVLSGKVGSNPFHQLMKTRFTLHDEAFKFLLADDLPTIERR